MTGRQAHIMPIKASWFVHSATRARADCQLEVSWATDMKRRIVIKTVLAELEGMWCGMISKKAYMLPTPKTIVR